MPPIDEKKIKAEFKTKAGKDPERYYPVEVLIEEGFKRSVCKKCGTGFWSRGVREVCGEPDCSGGYSFIGDSPATKKMDFIETWKEFSKLFKKLGYTPIKRYPVAARWRDDTDFVQASIYDFQPYVVSGEIEPPANPLVVPQFCLRFNDIDNVGYTGRHYTGFVMIGQHAFEPPEKYAPPDYLRHVYTWLVEGMGVSNDEIQFHEDAWAGGGNMGSSMEFFSRGLEIGNQVYMQYDIRSGTPKELAIKVLDMGMGQERPAWFTHGTATSYEANFGDAIKKLYRATGIKPNQEIVEKFLPYSGMLNFDEAEDIEKVWMLISSKIDVELKTLKEEIVPLADLYSIADHSRSLLVAITDGALPSNVGGGYNLRTLLRRSLDMLSSNSWDVVLLDVCCWHAAYLKPQYPELSERLDEVAELLNVEEKKHRETKAKSKRVVASIKGGISLDKLITLYDSQGITPQMLTDAGLKVKVPSDFYANVAQRHEKAAAKTRTRKELELPLNGLEKTDILYYDDYLLLDFEATVLKILDNKYVVLDRTAFYPTSGGQLHDIGTINGCKVTDTFKQGNIVVHVVSSPNFKEGNMVTGRIKRERRIQLAQHHTATHIINGVSRDILGEHIWQAGAEKTPGKARLDITHYETLSQDKLNKIERNANKIISENLPVESQILRRDMAETQYGFRLYQGGAVPGKELRIVKIDGLDVEACGGTHLKNTAEAGVVKLIGSTKIQDGIVRLEYAAGKAAMEYINKQVFQNAIKLLGDMIKSDLLPEHNPGLESRMKEIEEIQSQIRDEQSMLNKMNFVQDLDSELRECGQIFSVPPDLLNQTISRFRNDIHNFRDKIKQHLSRKKVPTKIALEKDAPIILGSCKALFTMWKDEKKRLDQIMGEIYQEHLDAISIEKINDYELVIPPELIQGSAKDTLAFAKKHSGERRIVVVFGVDDRKRISIVGLSSSLDLHMGELVREASKMLGGGGGGKPDFGQGAGEDLERVNEVMEFVRKNILYKLKDI
jgi:alanyl-tRNA synthetase